MTKEEKQTIEELKQELKKVKENNTILNRENRELKISNKSLKDIVYHLTEVNKEFIYKIKREDEDRFF